MAAHSPPSRPTDGRPSGRRTRRFRGLIGVAGVLGLLASGISASRADEALCGGASLRYASSSNNLYVSGPGVCTLTDLAGRTSAPLRLVDPGNKVWFLGANLILQEGATLRLHGSEIGGDVDELRLKSNNSSASTSIVFLRAQWGIIDMDWTKVTSWNEAAQGPDKEYASYKRAFIHVRSYLAPDGTARVSRMDIADSEVSDLGYAGAEAYGLTWKVSGSTASVPDLYDRVDVVGDVVRSRIHHNYFGVYTYGASGMRFIGNEFAQNIQYGLDPHDDSDGLIIEGNTSRDNGNHGIICSQRCDHLTIRNNVTSGNAGNGIMLHRSVVDTLVEGNRSFNNTDSGLAIFESHRNTIRGNQLTANKRGVRLSVGSSDNVLENNTIAGNSSYGVYFYKGSDAPTAGDGRPRRNRFMGNDVRDNTGYAVKMGDSDDNVFEANRFSGNGQGFMFDRSSGNQISNTELGSAGTIEAEGDGSPITNVLSNIGSATFEMDSTATFLLKDASRRVFETTPRIQTLVGSAGSELRLDSAVTGGQASVVTRNFTATVGSGTATVKLTSWQTTQRRAWEARAVAVMSQQVTYAIGDLLPARRYQASRDGFPLGIFTSDSAGVIRFSNAVGSNRSVAYVLTLFA